MQLLEHRYLFATLLGSVPLAAILLLAGRLRMTAILCGTILAAYSPPVACLYERVYWTPDHFFGGGWGIEDAIFCFHAGAVSWIFSLGPWRRSTQINPVALVAVRRLFAISLLAISGLVALLMSGFSVTRSFLLVQAASTAILILIKPSYLRLALSGAPIFIAYYFLLLSLWRILMPGFINMWNGTELTGATVLGVPIEEYLWVLSFCTGYPITMAFAFNVRFVAAHGSVGGKHDDVVLADVPTLSP